MKNLVNKLNEIGNQALFALNAEQVEKAAKAFQDTALECGNKYGNAEFTEDERNICADALIKVRLAVGAQCFIDCLEQVGVVNKARDVGVDSDDYIYSVDKETTATVNGEPVHAGRIAFTLTPAMIAFSIYNLVTDSAAEVIAATGEQIDIRHKMWQMINLMIFTDATGPEFTEYAVSLVKDILDQTAKRLHAANGDINQIKHTVH